jgi:hypothetical protein
VTAQLDMFQGTPAVEAEPATGRAARSLAPDLASGVPPSPYDPRPAYADAKDWDRMVRVVRATDKLRREHGLTGPELEVAFVGGAHRLRARAAHEIWTEL